MSYTCSFLPRLYNIAFSATTAVKLRVNGADIGLSTSVLSSSGTCNGVVNAWVQLQAGDVITLEADLEAVHDIKVSGGFAAIVDVESIIMSNSATMRVAKADEVEAEIVTGATPDAQNPWTMPDYDACEWTEAYELDDIEVHKLCKPLMWGTANWEFSSGAKYVWYPDRTETNIYMRLVIDNDWTSANCVTASVSATSSSIPSPYIPASSPETVVEQERKFLFAIDAWSTATIWKNAAYLSMSGGNCSEVDRDTGYYLTGTVIGFSIVGGTAGIFGLSDNGFASGRDVVRIMPVNEVDNSVEGRGAWLQPGFDACHWTEATVMDETSERWCKAEHYGSKNSTLSELPLDAKYVWFPSRATQDVYVRIEIGEDCDSKRIVRTERNGNGRAAVSEMNGGRVSKKAERLWRNLMEGHYVLNSVFQTSRTERTVASRGKNTVSTMDRQLRHENLIPVSAAFITDAANTFVCSPNGVIPVAFSAGGKAALYLNGESVAIHDTGCNGYTQAYVPVGPGTVIGFIAVGGPGERGVIAAIGGWYVTGFNAGFRVIDSTAIDRTVQPLSRGYADGCQWSSATEAADMTFCSATEFPYETGAQYVWADKDEMGNEVDSVYVRMQIGEGCLTTIHVGGKTLA